MASSGDELGSYEQSPRVTVSGRANAIAGPSKPAPKRKKAQTSEALEAAAPKSKSPDAIAISSGEDDVHMPRKRRTVGATVDPVPNGRISRRGKGNMTAAPKRKTPDEADELEAVENTAVDMDTDIISSRRRPASGRNTGLDNESLQKQNERLGKQLKDVIAQRDSLSGQLHELFQLRRTEQETQLIEQKAQYEAILKVKEDTVQELQSALSRVDKLTQSGATTSLHFLTRETAEEEKQDVQREVDRLKGSLKQKDEIIHSKDAEIAQLNDDAKVLRADLKAESEFAVFARNQPSSVTKHSSKSGDAKNSLVIRLYEELTNLLVTNVKHESGLFKEDDAIYTCVQTTSSGKSLNFTLKFFKEAEGDSPSNGIRSGRTVDKVVYTPLLLEKETHEFVAQLDFLAGPFTFQKEQMSVFTKTLMTYLEGEAEDSESVVEQMTVED